MAPALAAPLAPHGLPFGAESLNGLLEAKLSKSLKEQPSYKLFVRPDGITKLEFEFLKANLCTPALDKLIRTLWLAGTRQHTNISPLHRQLVKGRQISLSENPDMHLVRGVDKIYVKPIPPYLLMWEFWQDLQGGVFTTDLTEKAQIQKAAIGFLRSYRYLIQNESDFRLAVNKDQCQCLIPVDIGKWVEFANFICKFESDNCDPSDTSDRYQYGEVRLTRLKWLTRLKFIAMSFQDVDPYDDGSGAYLAQRFGPMLFFIAAISLILSAMQVALAAQADHAFRSWIPVSDVSRWFSSVTMIAIGAIIIFFGIVMQLVIYGNQLLYALRHFGNAIFGRH